MVSGSKRKWLQHIVIIFVAFSISMIILRHMSLLDGILQIPQFTSEMRILLGDFSFGGDDVLVGLLEMGGW